jgi:hypothetical protein
MLFEEIGAEIRNRKYLTYDDLALVFVWKALLWQVHREGTFRGLEADEAEIRRVTKLIFEIDHANRDDVRKLLESLDTLRGVGLPVATAILSIVFPTKYGAVDVHVRNTLGIPADDVDAHVQAIFRLREIAEEQQRQGVRKVWTPRMVDMALWKLDRDC